MNIAICSLGLTFIPIEDTLYDEVRNLLIGFTTNQLTPRVLATENIRIR